MERKTGKIQSWHQAKGYGIVSITFREAYFLHATSIKEAPADMEFPPVGATVHFDVTEPTHGGRLLQAVNATIDAPVVNGGAR